MSAALIYANDASTEFEAVPSKREATIADLSREFGITFRALRFYEQRGLLNPRREGVTRFYDEKAKARVALILKGKQLGFTLTEIRAMLAADAAGARNRLGMTRDQMRARLEALKGERSRVESGIRELEAELAA